jgi:hypothetical protein
MVCAALVVLFACSAYGDDVYLASSEYTLYRVLPDRESFEIESFEMEYKMRGMHYDAASDTVYVTSNPYGTVPATIYLLENAVSGTPVLTYYASLSQRYGSMTMIGEYFYGFDRGDLYRLDLSDPDNPIEEFIGVTGVVYTAGAAYDPVGETLYMISCDTDTLYEVSPETAEVTPIGGLGVDALDCGAAWYAGNLYTALQNDDSDWIEIGLVDTGSGVYSCLMGLEYGSGPGRATGLAIIPEPAGILMLLGAAGWIRRRA